LSVNNVALFPATTAAVNDYVAFPCGKSYTATYPFFKFNEVKINLATALAATSVTGVWEYHSRYSSTQTQFNWNALTVISDGTNGLTTTGTNSVVFQVPNDWHNFAYPLGSSNPVTGVYRFMVRYRITAISGQTAGGITASSASAVQTKRYSIDPSGYTTSGSGCTMADIYAADVAGGWGVVTNLGNFYDVNASIYIGATNEYFQSTSEMIQFQNGFSFSNAGRSQMGVLGTAGGTARAGTIMFFNSEGCDYNQLRIGANGVDTYYYNCTFVNYAETYSFNGMWGTGTNAGISMINTNFEGNRQLTFNRKENVYIGVRFDAKSPSLINAGSGCESPGAIIKNVSCLNTAHAFRCNATAGVGSYIHECDMSTVGNSPVNMWQVTTTVSGKYFYVVDCFWGAFADTAKVTWQNATTTGNLTDFKVFEVYSLLLKILDEAGNAISDATIEIKDKNGTVTHSLTTNADGYATEESGTVTTGAADSITDSSKSWTTDQFQYKEILITGGTGVGQRRIIKYGGTATNLPVAWDFLTTPSTDSNYIIIPYVNVKEFNPASFTVGAVQSTVTDFNPFTLTIQKSGYKKYKSKLTLSKALNQVITLQKITPFVVTKNGVAINLNPSDGNNQIYK
jgi:hypothetical protein